MKELIIGDDQDCVLDGDFAWVTVKNFSVKLRKTANGMSVSVFNLGGEDEGPIDELTVFDSVDSKEEV